MAKLALVRHGESEWNAKNLWTGWVDEPLTSTGFLQAREAAEKLRPTKWDIIFESDLQRVKETTEVIIRSLHLSIPVIETPALRERNYGVYTGQNKREIEKKLGSLEYLRLHRGWDYQIEKGESLKQVYERVVPYYLTEVEPRLSEGQNVLVVASGNSLRALVKYLRKLSDTEIERLEIKTGEVIFMSFPTQLSGYT